MHSPDLTSDELLTTTRAVRKRLDLERGIDIDVIKECIGVATQSPTGGNTQGWHFVVVADAGQRAALAELYRRAWKIYKQAPGSVYDLFAREPAGARKEQLGRVAESADYLVEHLHRVPVHVVPCIGGRVDHISGDFASVGLASVYGSILPATWSYMLAARARGLGTAWTTCHLMFEEAAAGILDIPYDKISQVALIATAYSIGKEFKPALRKPIDEILHIDRW
ncbi:MAG: nitroreductase family protein [Gammaproteobacteria bacterium]|jgi:nitroreductase|nr:nitroreductase [Chromatiales bacterium]MCP4927165.1 nitroreductase family protein [Gammaproteobacteria bacterium]MDP7153142.1 nitroreductase family protein [Gammaproteobacteria bacterium]MDP7296064.1 nitroreductase family protein [Gammaproteobacteria bacterium]MDP7419100.1 nitroreductase family protein [Gammaproteobacteria bacterium]